MTFDERTKNFLFILKQKITIRTFIYKRIYLRHIDNRFSVNTNGNGCFCSITIHHIIFIWHSELTFPRRMVLMVFVVVLLVVMLLVVMLRVSPQSWQPWLVGGGKTEAVSSSLVRPDWWQTQPTSQLCLTSVKLTEHLAKQIGWSVASAWLL